MVSKEAVNYRKATGKHNCGNCVMFHRDSAPSHTDIHLYSGKCDLVIGSINAEDTCDRWEAK